MTAFLPVYHHIYDVVSTAPYIKHDNLALNMAGTKQWYNISLKHFETCPGKVGAPRIAVKPHFLDVINKARSQWPQLLYGLSMLDEHKEKLRSHRAALTDDFKIL